MLRFRTRTRKVTGGGGGGTPVSGMAVGINLGGLDSYDGAWPFANVLMNAQVWERFSGAGSYTAGTQGDLTATVGTDEFRCTLSDNGLGLPAGTYTVWNPSGMNIGFGVFGGPTYYPYSTATGAGGSVTFSYPGGAGLFMFLKGSTSRASGVAALLLPGTYSTWAAGNVWNPDFLTYQASLGASVFRTMDWTVASANIETDWADRTLPDRITSYNHTAGGNAVPYEYIVDLANRLGKDPWICVPVRATSSYVTSLSNLLKTGTGAVGSIGASGLNTARTWWMEQGNEVWNYSNPWRSGTTWLEYFNHTKYTCTVNAATDVLTKTAHPFVNGDTVRSWSTQATRLSYGVNEGPWYPGAMGGDTFYVGVIDANTFKVYTDVARTTPYDYPTGVVSVLLAKTTETATALDASYGALAKARWDIADPIFTAAKIKHIIAAHAANSGTSSGRLGVTGVAARTDYLAIAPYFDGEYMAGQIVIGSGTLTPKFWCKSDGTFYVNFYPAGTAQPSDAALIAGTGATYHEAIPYTRPFDSLFVAGTTRAGTNGVAMKCFITFVNSGESRTSYYWTIATEQAPSASASTVTFFDTAANQLSRNKLDTDIDAVSYVTAHQANIAASANTAIKVIAYEGGNHMGGDFAPSLLQTWVDGTYLKSASSASALHHNLRTLASMDVYAHCYYADVRATNWSLSDMYTNTTDVRFVQLASYGGTVPKATRVAIADVAASDITSAPSLPYTVYTFPDASLTYTLMGGDTVGNYSMVGNLLKMVSTTGINFSSPGSAAIKVRAGDGNTDCITTVSFNTGSAYYSATAPFAMNMTTQAAIASLVADRGSNLAQTISGGALASGMLDEQGVGNHANSTAMTNTLDWSKPILLAIVIDKDNLSTVWTNIAKFGNGSSYVELGSGNPASTVDWHWWHASTAPGVDFATPVSWTSGTKAVVWWWYDPVGLVVQVGSNQTPGATNTTWATRGATTMSQDISLWADQTKKGSILIENGPIVDTQAKALAAVAKVQALHGI